MIQSLKLGSTDERPLGQMGIITSSGRRSKVNPDGSCIVPKLAIRGSAPLVRTPSFWDITARVLPFSHLAITESKENNTATSRVQHQTRQPTQHPQFLNETYQQWLKGRPRRVQPSSNPIGPRRVPISLAHHHCRIKGAAAAAKYINEPHGEYCWQESHSGTYWQWPVSRPLMIRCPRG